MSSFDLLQSILEDGMDRAIGCDCDDNERQVDGSFKMKEAEAQSMQFVHPVVVGLEYCEKGSRLFFTTSWKHLPHFFMWIRSKENYAKYSTWHEVLLPDYPVKLYADLEYYTIGNERIDGGEMVQNVINELIKFMTEQYDAEAKNMTVVQLNATTEEKFSRHIIFNSDRIEFKMEKLGRLVHEFLRKNVALMAVNPQIGENGKPVDSASMPNTQPNADDSEESEPPLPTTILDNSPYQKGQNFRMFLSPKYGQDNVLRLVEENAEHPFSFDHQGCAVCIEVLRSTLVTSPLPRQHTTSFWMNFVNAFNYHKGDRCESVRAALNILYEACNVTNLLFVTKENSEKLVKHTNLFRNIHAYIEKPQMHLGLLSSTGVADSCKLMQIFSHLRKLLYDKDIWISTLSEFECVGARRDLFGILQLLMKFDDNGSKLKTVMQRDAIWTDNTPSSVRTNLDNMNSLISHLKKPIDSKVQHSYHMIREHMPKDYQLHLPAAIVFEDVSMLLEALRSLDKRFTLECSKKTSIQFQKFVAYLRLLVLEIEFRPHCSFGENDYGAELSNKLLLACGKEVKYLWLTYIKYGSFNINNAFDVATWEGGIEGLAGYNEAKDLKNDKEGKLANVLQVVHAQGVLFLTAVNKLPVF